MAHVQTLEKRILLSGDPLAPQIADLDWQVDFTDSTHSHGFVTGTITDNTPASAYDLEWDLNSDGIVDGTTSVSGGGFSWSLSVPHETVQFSLRAVEPSSGPVGEWVVWTFNSSGSGSVSGSGSGSGYGGTSGSESGSTPDLSWLVIEEPTFEARDDYYVLHTGAATSEHVLAVLANDTNDGLTPVSIASVSPPLAGQVRIEYSTAFGADVLVYEAPVSTFGSDSFAYTIEDSQGRTASATVTVKLREINSGSGSGSGGGGGSSSDITTLLDSGVILDPLTPISVSRPGPLNLSRSSSSSVQTSFGGRSYSGTQSEEVYVSYTVDGNGDWSYLEIVSWTYGVSAADGNGSSWSSWGGYFYTLAAYSIDGVQGFWFVFHSNDSYANTLVSEESSASSGLTLTTLENGTKSLAVLISNTTNTNLGTAVGVYWQTQVGNHSHVGTGTYWYSIPGGLVDGDVGNNGGRSEFSHMSLVFTSVVPSTWVAMGTAYGHGDEHHSQDYEGAGTYTSSDLSGYLAEGGGQNDATWFHYATALTTDFTWQGTGAGQSSGSAHRESAYSGSGTYATSGSSASGGVVISSWQRSGTNTGYGSESETSRYQLDFGLAAGGWALTNGTASANGQNAHHTGFAGDGLYIRHENGGTIQGTLTDNGTSDDISSYLVTSNFTGSQWLTTGSASSSAAGESYSSYGGSGTYHNGAIAGTVEETGANDRNWNSLAFWTLDNGAWTLASGQSSDAGSSSSRRWFSGSGTEHEQQAEGNDSRETWNRKWESGERKSWEEFWTQSSVVNGEWRTVDGQGSGSGISSAQASNSATGVYSYEINFGVIDGTLSGSGAQHASGHYTTASVWNGTGWSTSGISLDAESGFAQSSFSGSGSYGRTIGENSGTGDYTTIAGDLVEHGRDASAWDSTSVSELDEEGEWVLVNGSGNGQASGRSFFSYSGAGTYRRTSAANPQAAAFSDWDVTGSLAENGGRGSEWSNRTNSHIANAAWSTAGTSSGSGAVWEATSLSGSGTYSFDDGELVATGEMTHADGFSDRWTYTTAGTLLPNGNWLTTGSGSGSSSAFTTFQFDTTSGTRTVSLDVPATSWVYDNGGIGSPVEETWFEQTGSITYDVTEYLYDQQTASVNYHMTLDTEGEWQLAGGTGTYSMLQGLGERQSGTGSVTTITGWTGENSSQLYELVTSKDIEHNTLEETAVGTYTVRGFIDGGWTLTDGGATASGRSFNERSESGTGVYTSGYIAGAEDSLSQQLSDYRWQSSVDAAGNHSGSVQFTQQEATAWSYSVIGTDSITTTWGDSYVFHDHDGLTTESGEGETSLNASISLTRASTGEWSFASGTLVESYDNQHSYNFHGSRELESSGSGSASAWHYSGSAWLQIGGSTQRAGSDSWSLNPSGSWTLDTATRSSGQVAYTYSSGFLSGAYTFYLGDGELNGDYESVWYYGDYTSYDLSGDYEDGSWTKTGTGMYYRFDRELERYSGSGSYTALEFQGNPWSDVPGNARTSYSGSISHAGEREFNLDLTRLYTFYDDDWYLTDGDFDLSTEDRWSYEFSGSGTTLITVYGGHVSGAASEAGNGAFYNLFEGVSHWDPTTQQWWIEEYNGAGYQAASYTYSRSASGDVIWNVPNYGNVTVLSDRQASGGWSLDENWTYWLDTTQTQQGGTPSFELGGTATTVGFSTAVDSASDARGNETLEFEQGYHYQQKLIETWDVVNDDFSYLGVTSNTRHRWGSLDYANSGSTSYSSSGSGGNSSFYNSWFERELHDSYSAWEATTGERTIDANGEREWWEVSGTLSGSGMARQLLGAHSGSTNPGSGSGSGSSYEYYQETEATDHYDMTGTWLDRRDEDGTRTQSGTLSNQRSGTWNDQGFYNSQTPWSSSGHAWSTSDSYSGNVAELGFQWPAWSQQEDWRPAIGTAQFAYGGLSYSGNYFSQWNENAGSGSGSGTGSGSGGASNPPPPAVLPVIPEFGDVEFTPQTPTRDALVLADWLPAMSPGHSLNGSEPPAGNGWNPWETVTDTVGLGWTLYRTTMQLQASHVRNVGQAVSGFIQDTGANTRNAWVGGAAGFVAGLVEMTTNVIAGPLDPLTTTEHAIYGTIDTYNTYAEQGGVLLGLSAATGVHRLGEAIGGADILDGRTLSGDEVFDRATEGVGNALGTGATIGGSIVGGARALGYKGFKVHVDVAKTAATNAADDAAHAAKEVVASARTTVDDLVIDTYGNLSRRMDLPGQAHHLNQTAAYGDVVPTRQGASIKLEGNILTDAGTPHARAHRSLEGFWNQYRGSDIVPTNLEYTRALQQSLRAAGLSESQVQQAVRAAIRERVDAGALGGRPVPRIPNPIRNLTQ